MKRKLRDSAFVLTVPVLVGLAVVVGLVEWPCAPVALGPSGSADAGAESRASLTSPSPPLRHTVSPGAYHYGNDGVMADASPAGCAIQGEVRDSLGRPIPGVKVAVIDQRRRSIAASGCSDSQGRFAVEGLECSRFVVMPELDRQTSEWIAPFYGDGWPLEAIEDSAALLAPVVVLTEREPRGEAVVTLYRKASVSGVVTASGRPVESAVVRLEPKKFPAFALDVVSDRGGAFTFPDVLPGPDYRLKVVGLDRSSMSEGYDAPPPMDLDIPESARLYGLSVECVVADRSIDGYIVDEAGDPIRGLDVVCYYSGARLSDIVARTQTDERGYFLMSDAPAASLRLQVAPEDGLQTVGVRVLASVPAPMPVDTRSGLAHHVGVVRLERNAVFNLAVNIQANPSARDSVSVGDLRAVMARGIHGSEGMASALRGDPGFVARNVVKFLDVQALSAGSGRIVWSCAPPFEEHTLLVYSTDRGLSVWRILRVSPKLGESVIEVRY